MGIFKNVSWCDPMGARPETAKLKWTLIRGKRVSVIAGLVAVVSVIVAVGVILTCTGCIFAAITAKIRMKKNPSRTSPYSQKVQLPHPHIGIRLRSLTREPLFPSVKMTV